MASAGEEEVAEKKADDARSTLHRDVASVMAEPGFSITETRMDGGGWLLLHLTAFKGDAPCLAMLLEAVGAYEGVNQVNAGATPLRFAAQGGHHRCMELLIAAGANANAATPGAERREEKKRERERERERETKHVRNGLFNTQHICALQHAVYDYVSRYRALCAARSLTLYLYASVSLCLCSRCALCVSVCLCTVSLSDTHTLSRTLSISRSLDLSISRSLDLSISRSLDLLLSCSLAILL